MPIVDVDGDGGRVDTAVADAIGIGGCTRKCECNAIAGLLGGERDVAQVAVQTHLGQRVIDAKGGAGDAAVANLVGSGGLQRVLTGRCRVEFVEPGTAVERAIRLCGVGIDDGAVGLGQLDRHSLDAGTGIDGVDREPVGLVGEIATLQRDVSERVIGIDCDKLLIAEIEPG